MSAADAWRPFVLVAGLVSVGAVAAADGLFEAVAARIARSRIGARGLLLALLALVAAVTVVLNLDTAVVFLTPVLIHAARQRALDERPFLYGSVFMANAASLLLPAPNLTNLLVLRADRQNVTAFATHMLPAWAAACVVTAAFLLGAFRPAGGTASRGEPPPLRLSVGAAAMLAAVVLVVTLQNPALPVLGVGVAATAARRIRPQVGTRLLTLLFALTVVLGTIARVWRMPGDLASGGVWRTAGIAALASVVVNNLPAAVMLSADPTTHPDALLLGLDLGPNLAVTGSLAAVLWLSAARAVGSDASIATYSRLGVIVVPATLLAALVASALIST